MEGDLGIWMSVDIMWGVQSMNEGFSLWEKVL